MGTFPWGLLLGNSRWGGLRLGLSFAPSFLCLYFFFFFEDEHGAGAALGDAATPVIRDGPRNTKGLPPRAGGLGGRFSLLGGVNSTEEAGVD